MRTYFPVSLALVVGAVVLPSTAIGQAPTQDSVIANVPTRDLVIDARSGPSGENPTGTAAFKFSPFDPVAVGGSVTCLAVTGRTGRLVAKDESGFLTPPAFLVWAVIDNQGTGTPDRFGVFPLSHDPGCSGPPLGQDFAEPITSGDIAVVDAQPLPTSKDQCKDGGWRNYPGFKNQGDCVSFVATHGKPAAS